MKTETNLLVEKLCLLLIGELGKEIESSVKKAINEKFKSINNNASEDTLIATSELQKFISISKSAIEGLKEKGMPYYKIGDSVRFKKQEVLQFLQQYKIEKGGQVSK